MGVFLGLAGVQRTHGFKVKHYWFPRFDDQPVSLRNAVDRRVTVQAVDVPGQPLTPPLKRLTALADVAGGTGGHHVANGVIRWLLGYTLICQANDRFKVVSVSTVAQLAPAIRAAAREFSGEARCAVSSSASWRFQWSGHYQSRLDSCPPAMVVWGVLLVSLDLRDGLQINPYYQGQSSLIAS